MIKTLLQLTAVLVILSPTVVLADYGDLWITSTALSQGKPIQGRLEFEDHNGAWGTVCDVGFTERAGNVACKQLGFVRAEKVLYKQFGNQSRLPITICATECTGKESRLSQCKLKSCKDSALYQLPCKKENIIGIQCTNLSSPIAEVNGNNLDEVGSGIGNVNENGNPIDDEDIDDNNGGGSRDNVGSVDDAHVDNDDNNNDQDDEKSVVTLPKFSDGTDDDNDDKDDDEVAVILPFANTESDESQSNRKHSDDSISAGVIFAIMLSCLFVIAVILFVLGIVCWGYKRHHPTFVVTQDYPKILVASGTTTTTTSIPKSYMQAPRLTPKGYEALPVTDYMPVQPVVKKPIY